MSINNTANRGDIVDADVTTISTTTETSIQAAGGAYVYLDLVSVVIANTSASAVRVDFRPDTAANVKLAIQVPAGETRGVSFSIPKNQTSPNKPWTAQLSTAVTDVRISPQFIKRN